MNWDRVEGNWKQGSAAVGKIDRRWSRRHPRQPDRARGPAAATLRLRQGRGAEADRLL